MTASGSGLSRSGRNPASSAVNGSGNGLPPIVNKRSLASTENRARGADPNSQRYLGEGKLGQSSVVQFVALEQRVRVVAAHEGDNAGRAHGETAVCRDAGRRRDRVLRIVGRNALELSPASVRGHAMGPAQRHRHGAGLGRDGDPATFRQSAERLTDARDLPARVDRGRRRWAFLRCRNRRLGARATSARAKQTWRSRALQAKPGPVGSSSARSSNAR